MDGFNFEQAVARLGRRVVMGVANTADPRLGARLGQPFGVLDGQASGAAAVVADQPHGLGRVAFMGGRLAGIEKNLA